MSRKEDKWTAKAQEHFRKFRAAGTSEQSAKHYLSNHGGFAYSLFFSHCTLEELRNWQKAIQSKKSEHHALPNLQLALVEKLQEQQIANTERAARNSLAGRLRSFENLSARDLILEAEELTAPEVEALLAWEQSQKNRASVIQALAGMLGGSPQVGSGQPAATSRPSAITAPNPFESENKKVYARGRGTVRERCLSCGEINSLDVEVVSAIVHRRTNSIKGRMESWANRQIEGGSRMTGRITASEAAKANRMSLGRMVSEGIPCANCGAPMIR